MLFVLEVWSIARFGHVYSVLSIGRSSPANNGSTSGNGLWNSPLPSQSSSYENMSQGLSFIFFTITYKITYDVGLNAMKNGQWLRRCNNQSWKVTQ